MTTRIANGGGKPTPGREESCPVLVKPESSSDGREAPTTAPLLAARAPIRRYRFTEHEEHRRPG